MRVSLKHRVIVVQRSGNICAMPTCRKILTRENTQEFNHVNIGELAHIKGENKGSPRYDETMTDEERNHHSNLIYLCRTCHGIIDKQINKYTVEVLCQIKQNHEEWVRNALEKEILDVGFFELNQIIRSISSITSETTSVKSINESLPLQEKMKRNELTDTIHFDLQLGLLKVKEVGEYVDNIASTDFDFPFRLKKGFVDQYNYLLLEGFKGDSLFESLVEFSTKGNYSLKNQAAGIAVLVYLFEKCEVFES